MVRAAYLCRPDQRVNVAGHYQSSSAYGLPTARIENQNDLSQQIRAVLEARGPVVCDLVCLPDEPRMPSLSSAQRADGSIYSKPLEDLWPFLDRDEFHSNMIIDLFQRNSDSSE